MAKKKTKTTAEAKDPSRAKTDPGRKVITRPLKITQEIIDQAAAIVRRGNFRYVARGQLGISEGTWKTWLSYGRRDLRESEEGKTEMSLQAKFVVALDKAENIVHDELIRDILASDNDKLKLEYLCRRYPKLYSKNINAHDDDTGETVRVDPLELLAEKLKPFID